MSNQKAICLEQYRTAVSHWGLSGRPPHAQAIKLQGRDDAANGYRGIVDRMVVASAGSGNGGVVGGDGGRARKIGTDTRTGKNRRRTDHSRWLSLVVEE